MSQQYGGECPRARRVRRRCRRARMPNPSRRPRATRRSRRPQPRVTRGRLRCATSRYCPWRPPARLTRAWLPCLPPPRFPRPARGPDRAAGGRCTAVGPQATDGESAAGAAPAEHCAGHSRERAREPRRGAAGGPGGCSRFRRAPGSRCCCGPGACSRCCCGLGACSRCAPATGGCSRFRRAPGSRCCSGPGTRRAPGSRCCARPGRCPGTRPRCAPAALARVAAPAPARAAAPQRRSPPCPSVPSRPPTPPLLRSPPPAAPPRPASRCHRAAPGTS